MTRRNRWFTVGVIFAGVLVAQIVLMSRIISPAPEVDEPPAESNRTRHELGFSIIKPGGTRAMHGESFITILPESGRSRYHPVFSVAKLLDATDPPRMESGFQPGTFQNRDAFIYVGPSGKYWAYRAIMKRGGAWFEVGLLLPGEGISPMPPPQWQRYLETFDAGAE